MRRRFQKFLPIILIALVVQILAPIGVTWAAAIAAGDPLSAAPICHGGQDGLPSHSDQSGGRGPDGCASVLLLGPAPAPRAPLDTPETAAVAVPCRVAARVIWRDEAPDFSPARAGSNAQARAPPLSM